MLKYAPGVQVKNRTAEKNLRGSKYPRRRRGYFKSPFPSVFITKKKKCLTPAFTGAKCAL
jgi:hypothetical protein